MGFSQENGYVPTDIDAIMLSIMNNINTQFASQLTTPYTAETFAGTNFYKYFYALAQKLQENEVKTSEIFSKLQQYIAQTNEDISRPVVTGPGVIEALETAGYVSSVKPPEDADAGKIFVCVDVDDGVHAEGNITITSYANLVSGTDDSVGVAGVTFTAQVGAATPGAATFQAATSNNATAASLALQINSHATTSVLVRARAVAAVVYIEALQGGTGGNSIALAYTDNDSNVGATKSGTTLSGGETNVDYADIKTAICELLSTVVVGGVISQGLESEAVVLSNGQSFDFKYYLPNRLETYLKLTITLSENNQSVILSDTAVKELLLANIAEKYRLGRNFEPQKYFTILDAPWAASVLLEYSHDSGATWSSTIYDADFDELFECDLANITIVSV
jgi:hypothetical protein